MSEDRLQPERHVSSITPIIVSAGAKLLLAIIVYIIGHFIIKLVLKAINKNTKLSDKIDGTVKSFIMSFVKIALYIVLVISIIGIMGVPMASVVTVLASGGVAIGLALQGSLANLAGGIMLMIFKPFKQGDYVSAAGASGTVKEITIFYTTFLSVDNQKIMVPNGSLMNANITNYSSEEFRRVDLEFACAKSENVADIQKLILNAISATDKVLSDPAPFARLSGATNESSLFAARVWCKSEDYWDVYFDATEKVANVLAAAGVKSPAVRVISENN